MEAKEVIKDAVREKLLQLSKEELIDIIADLSSVYISSQVFAGAASALSSLKTTGFGELINATTSNIAKHEFSNHQVCKADDWLFGRNNIKQ